MSSKYCYRRVVSIDQAKAQVDANIHSAVFQAGGLTVVLAEVDRKTFLASIVPVIVNSVLNNHHFVVDIVAFVVKGDFPRSRLGEKQRGKILASWVTRKMRTIAQFAIRDGMMDDDHSSRRQSSLGPRGSMSSTLVMSQQGSGSLRGRDSSFDALPAELHSMTIQEGHAHTLPQNEFLPELPTTYPGGNMLTELPADESADDQTTPTANSQRMSYKVMNHAPRANTFELSTGENDYSPIDTSGPFGREFTHYELPATGSEHVGSSHSLMETAQNLPGSLLPPAAIAELRGAGHHAISSDESGDEAEKPPPLPSYANKPYLSMLTEETGRAGYIPNSPTYGGRRSRDNSRPSSRAGQKATTAMSHPPLSTIPSQPEVPQIGRGESNNWNTEQWGSQALTDMGVQGPPPAVPKRKDVPHR
jgi:hypothetical protein